jgi:uncharacterized protein
MRSISGATRALFRAVFNYGGDPATILLLRQAGADIDRQNSPGVSPRALAARIANHDAEVAP